MALGSLFGGRRRMRGAAVPENLGVNPIQPDAQKPDIPTGEVRSRRSFMGGPSTLAVLGATLRQLDGGNELDEFLVGQRDQQYQRDMFGLRAAQGKREDAETELARQERLAEIARPPVRYSDLERIDGRLGQRNEVTGQYDWAPQVPNAGGPAPPSGYRPTADGALEAIPGGPADVRATAEGRSRMGQMESSARSLQNAISALDDAERLVNGNSTGFVGQLTRGVGGTRAYNLNQALEPVRAILSFETLAEMRRNSATGGALGSIAVRELELLGNTMRSLDTAQSEQQVRSALNTTRSQLQRTLQAIEAARAEMQGGGQQAPAGGGDGVRVIELEPE